MLFKVTEIEFDFDNDPDYLEDYTDVTLDTLETLWEAVNEDDLIDEITNTTGWCIKSIDFYSVTECNKVLT